MAPAAWQLQCSGDPGGVATQRTQQSSRRTQASTQVRGVAARGNARAVAHPVVCGTQCVRLTLCARHPVRQPACGTQCVRHPGVRGTQCAWRLSARGNPARRTSGGSGNQCRWRPGGGGTRCVAPSVCGTPVRGTQCSGGPRWHGTQAVRPSAWHPVKVAPRQVFPGAWHQCVRRPGGRGTQCKVATPVQWHPVACRPGQATQTQCGDPVRGVPAWHPGVRGARACGTQCAWRSSARRLQCAAPSACGAPARGDRACGESAARAATPVRGGPRARRRNPAVVAPSGRPVAPRARGTVQCVARARAPSARVLCVRDAQCAVAFQCSGNLVQRGAQCVATCARGAQCASTQACAAFQCVRRPVCAAPRCGVPVCGAQVRAQWHSVWHPGARAAPARGTQCAA
ncbi:hypothetical protein GPJ56_004552 [Histomonas meleagridis]|nr:hypothetical protein GPJ56_004552 [Histomonas meleagridis]